MSEDVVRLVVVSGRVQGVGYRAWVAHTADGLGLKGWVRNRGDGRVEALFAGPADLISDMIARCRRGPTSARVEHVSDDAGHTDALTQRASGEQFSVIQTI